MHCLHADALEKLSRLPEALAVLQQTPPNKLGLAQQGRLLDRMGRYDEAFAAFVAAKQLALADKVPYRQAEAEAMAAALKGFFTRERIATLRPAARRDDVPQPIFIVGFPRSGTTLVEQTLTLNPRITAGDELHFINRIVGNAPKLLDAPLSYPTALADLWMGDKLNGLDDLRDAYLRDCRDAGLLQRGTAGEGRDAVWFTDKMPLNEMHLGLIGLLFPQSPVVHLIRHPLDVVLSVFSQNMSHGYDCDTAIESIAHHNVLVADLVAHYRENMALRYLAIRYEDIVERQEDSIRTLMAFIGEDFHPTLLAFDKNPRIARTPSAAQVSEALYTRSRYRYRHYLPQLQPVIPLLRPLIEQLGYGIAA
jgi:hypothetical protein